MRYAVSYSTAIVRIIPHCIRLKKNVGQELRSAFFNTKALGKLEVLFNTHAERQNTHHATQNCQNSFVFRSIFFCSVPEDWHYAIR